MIPSRSELPVPTDPKHQAQATQPHPMVGIWKDPRPDMTARPVALAPLAGIGRVIGAKQGCSPNQAPKPAWSAKESIRAASCDMAGAGGISASHDLPVRLAPPQAPGR